MLWAEHHKRILKISLTLSNMKLKSLNSKNDPLLVRLPYYDSFLIYFYGF
jgi:hypothetical protein